MVDVNKVIIKDDTLVVDFKDEKGSFKMSVNTTGENEPSPDLFVSIRKMIDIFAYRMDLEAKRDSLTVLGLESGRDQRGLWFRIHGSYTAHTLEHKVATGKLREIIYYPGDYDEQGNLIDISSPEREEELVSEYPSLLTEDEHGILIDCLAEAQAFVGGKRLQKQFEFEEDAP